MTGTGGPEQGSPLRRGDVVTLTAVVRERYVDADAARHTGDDGQRLVVELASGALLHTVRVGDVTRGGDA